MFQVMAGKKHHSPSFSTRKPGAMWESDLFVCEICIFHYVICLFTNYVSACVCNFVLQCLHCTDRRVLSNMKSFHYFLQVFHNEGNVFVSQLYLYFCRKCSLCHRISKVDLHWHQCHFFYICIWIVIVFLLQWNLGLCLLDNFPPFYHSWDLIRTCDRLTTTSLLLRVGSFNH